VFCGTFTAGAFDADVGDGRMTITKEGKSRKFLDHVEQITFSGQYAAANNQTVLYVTERAVFRLTIEGLELIEVAPGVDIARDILAHMDFAPIVRDVALMDSALFQEKWGRLGALLDA